MNAAVTPPAEEPEPPAAAVPPPGAATVPAEPPRGPASGPSKALLREYLEALLIAVIFATFARAFVVQAFKIPSGSMEQNLLVGDHVLVNKFVFGPTRGAVERWLLPSRPVARGDVVVFKFPEAPERDFIKRCVGLPGDTIEIVDKHLKVNGTLVRDDSYVYHVDPNTYPRTPLLADTYRLRDNYGPFKVPAGHYFFLGDNRDNSNDSRFWGPVPVSYIRGRAFMIYWSFRSQRESIQWPGYWGRLKQLSQVVAGFPTHTRWERSFRIVR